MPIYKCLIYRAFNISSYMGVLFFVMPSDIFFWKTLQLSWLKIAEGKAVFLKAKEGGCSC